MRYMSAPVWLFNHETTNGPAAVFLWRDQRPFDLLYVKISSKPKEPLIFFFPPGAFGFGRRVKPGYTQLVRMK